MSVSDYKLARKALGNAVHESALRRLFDLWPDAVVDVSHADGSREGVPSRVTRVWIRYNDDVSIASMPERTVYALGEARCRLDQDNWLRQRGIKLAFNRALKRVSAIEKGR